MIKTYTTKLSKRAQLTNDIFLYSFDIEGDEIEFTAGQYVILMVPQNGETVVRRLFSIASPAYQKKNFDLLIQYVPGGIASTYLAGLQIGASVTFQGPAGVFTMKETGKNKILLATGNGIAPIRSLLLTRAQQGPFKEKYYLLWGVRTAQDLYFLEDLKGLHQKSPNFQCIICLSRETDMLKVNSIQYCIAQRIDACLNVRILDTLKKQGSAVVNSFDYYICGGAQAVDDLRADLLDAGAEKANIVFEKFV